MFYVTFESDKILFTREFITRGERQVGIKSLKALCKVKGKDFVVIEQGEIK